MRSTADRKTMEVEDDTMELTQSEPGRRWGGGGGTDM